MRRRTLHIMFVALFVTAACMEAVSFAQQAQPGRAGQTDGATSATARGRAGRGLRAGRGMRGNTPTTVPLSSLAPARHEEFVALAKQGNIDLVFFGDSITDFWRRDSPRGGKAVWDKTWAPLKAANFGISGERVEHVLWRAENGELEGYKPKLVVLMIGTNNFTGGATNQGIVDGIKNLCVEIERRQPDAKLLLLGIFPRVAAPTNPYRPRIKEINAALAKMDDGKKLFFLDIGEKLLAADGTLTTEIMPDGLHPNEQGYQIWADATLPKVKELMGTK